MDTKTFVSLIVFLFAGVWLGFNAERKTRVLEEVVVKKAVQKPIDTIPIGGCSREIGIRQVRTGDLPFGPIYLTYQGRTIGLEFQLTKDELGEGKFWSKIPLQEATFNNMDISWVSSGDDGQPAPHYDIRLFTISDEERKQINC